MSKYFKDVNTLAELRSQYKKLLKKYHPDNNGDSGEAPKAINVEYEQLFKQLKDKHTTEQQANNASSHESSYSKNMYNWENDKALREMLTKIINFSNIEIEIIGQRIWVFNSSNYRKELKATVNLLPSPGALCTVIVPPCPSTIDLASGSPRPAPCVSSEFLLR